MYISDADEFKEQNRVRAIRSIENVVIDRLEKGFDWKSRI
jgi:hypothetical protein